MHHDDVMSLAVAAPREEDQPVAVREPVARVRSTSGVGGWLPLLPLALFLALALLGPWLVPTSPDQQDLLNRLQPPAWAGGSWDHPIGTDGLGRDLFARLAYGARFSLGVGLLATINAAVVGVTLGGISGLAGGALDRVVTALVTVGMAIPGIVIGIVVTAALGQGLLNLIIILLLGGWIIYARIVRLQALAIARSEFVTAAVALGGRRGHILRWHLLPNLLPTVMVLLAQGVAAVMVYEATLTYLGLGLSIESVTLGSLVREGQQVLFTAWWVGFFPGAAIALAIVGFNFAADWAQARMHMEQSNDAYL